MTRARYRIRFSKTGPLRQISHRDLVRLWERLLRRVQLKLSMTEGFHPKPRMSFPSALALGTESLDEVVELDLAEQFDPSDLVRRLQDDQQPGLGILQVTAVPEGSRKAQLCRATYNLPIPEAHRDALRQDIETLKSKQTIEVARNNKTLVVSVAGEIPEIQIDDQGRLVFTLAPSPQASLRPSDLIEVLNIQEITDNGQFLTRTRVELEDEIDSTTSVTEQKNSE